VLELFLGREGVEELSVSRQVTNNIERVSGFKMRV
jgi:hypothetical protein